MANSSPITLREGLESRWGIPVFSDRGETFLEDELWCFVPGIYRTDDDAIVVSGDELRCERLIYDVADLEFRDCRLIWSVEAHVAFFHRHCAQVVLR